MHKGVQTALVTGAATGIGFAICRRFSSAGYNVALNDIDLDAAREAASNMPFPERCHALGGDASDIKTVYSLVENTVSLFGSLHITVANAGITRIAGFLELSSQDFEDMVNLNLRGSFFLAQATAKQIKIQKSTGRIVFVSSVTGRRGIKGLAAYGMTKAGLEMLAKSCALELAPLKITVNAVAPGATLTPRTSLEHPNYEKAWSALNPSGRVANPEDIAHAVHFLTTPEAEYINGQVLVVDGGWTRAGVVPNDLI